MPQPQSGYFIFTVRAVWSRERERGGEETMYVSIILCVYGTLSSLKYVKTRGRDPKY